MAVVVELGMQTNGKIDRRQSVRDQVNRIGWNTQINGEINQRTCVFNVDFTGSCRIRTCHYRRWMWCAAACLYMGVCVCVCVNDSVWLVGS